MEPTGRCRIDEEPVEAAGPVDAQNASTAPWKTTEQFSTSFHRQHHATSEGDISNELRMGTFLTSVDIQHGDELTAPLTSETLLPRGAELLMLGSDEQRAAFGDAFGRA